MGLTAAINQAMMEPPDVPLGDSRFLKDGAAVGSWQVLGLVGRGGNGEVYRVKHVKSGAIGALKVLCRDDPHLRRRFELESEILQKTSSYTSEGTRHFPHFLDKGIILCKNAPYIVIEFLHEFKLPDREQPQMEGSDVARIILGVCEAIRELHANGYLHRDIKSANLMQREDGEVVLIDFGFAIRIEDVENPLAERVSVTQGQRVGVGTPGSTAPEQAFGSASVSGDVYAIGALADECFRGEPPAKWSSIIKKATSPNDEFRYHDVEELETAVRNCLREVQADKEREMLEAEQHRIRKRRETRRRRIKKIVGIYTLGLAIALPVLLFVCKVVTEDCENFSIPESLYGRMLIADIRYRFAGTEIKGDLFEGASLGESEEEFTNAVAIAARPRGEMKYATDGMSDEDRSKIWPFDVESFEKKLENQMLVDTNGLFLLRTSADRFDSEGENVWDSHMTLRYVNREIETWAVAQLDRVWPRMSETNKCAMFKAMKGTEEQLVWTIDGDFHFVIRRCANEIGSRQYSFVQWDGKGSPRYLASFDSFPIKKAAVSVFPCTGASAANNLAVMMWSHQCDRFEMRPSIIRMLLEVAQDAGVPVAAANLEEMRRHIPEAFAEEGFSIPSTLVERMLTANLDALLRNTAVTNDVLELTALFEYERSGGLTWTNIKEIASRPRGEMKLANDWTSNRELAAVWPFDIESFEEELESRLIVDTNGVYRLCRNDGHQDLVDDDSLGGERTLQYVNSEIEAWAVKRLDCTWPRVCSTNIISYVYKKQRNFQFWKIADEWYFMLERIGGPLGIRQYSFINTPPAREVFVVARFNSFPSKKEAHAVLPARKSPACANNLAVMMWRHQCDRSWIRPWFIKELLQFAQTGGVSVATSNLDVLRMHLPEAFEAEDFAVPLSLVERMMEAVDDLAIQNNSVTNDYLEEWALEQQYEFGHEVWSNSVTVSSRPRGKMRFSDEGLTEKEIATIWPFEIESYENELEERMTVDTNGLYCLIRPCGLNSSQGMSLLDADSTVRYANCQIEEWAIKHLDRVWPRLSQEDFRAITGKEAMSNEIRGWRINDDWCFVLSREAESRLEWRTYEFVRFWDKDHWLVAATFSSFPSKIEAATVLRVFDSPTAANNLAVMMWKHQCDRARMRPWLILAMLVDGQKGGVSVSSSNLEVLRQHMPEVLNDKAD